MERVNTDELYELWADTIEYVKYKAEDDFFGDFVYQYEKPITRGELRDCLAMYILDAIEQATYDFPENVLERFGYDNFKENGRYSFILKVDGKEVEINKCNADNIILKLIATQAIKDTKDTDALSLYNALEKIADKHADKVINNFNNIGKFILELNRIIIDRDNNMSFSTGF